MKISAKCLLLTIVFALLSCGGSEGVIYEAYGKSIGPKGGKYTGVDNVTVIVPPKAVSKEIAFTIFSIDTPSFTSVSKPVTHIYIVAPAAYEFKVPVTVIIPYRKQQFLICLMKWTFSHTTRWIDRHIS